ncbi:MAG: 5-oxoprolinase [Chloroflexi bacterium]|nr:MAG: 5-oxoprolinase [Chloroflexota bacterium]
MTQATTAVSLAIFHHLFASVAEEMGVTLSRAAYSPNIKERLDFSCALFLGDGRLLAQAAHIPVHLGAMPASVQAAIQHCTPFQAGDVIIVNDPYQGGNHLPDITLVSPIFIQEPAKAMPDFFVASRAHHADVGGMTPGSMPLSTEIFQEGIIIPPIKLIEAGKRNEAVWQLILRNVRTPQERQGDLAAQLAAHAIGEKRLLEISERYTLAEAVIHAQALIDYANKMTRAAITQIPNGRYTFTDTLDNDDTEFIPIAVTITINDDQIHVDFSGTGTAVTGNLNAVPAIVISAVAYCIRCIALALLAGNLPMNEGAFTPITVKIPPGSLLDPLPPHAVAAGNVETSQRIVDVIFGALAQALPELIPAAGQGTMNNLTFGGTDPQTQRPFAYYETIGGGAGAGPEADGASGIHVHMSNTLNTPIEAMEHLYPLRIEEYSLRQNSGGTGKHQGGDGLVRALRFLSPVSATITSERRQKPAYGLHQGNPGAPGKNSLITNNVETQLPSKVTLHLQANDILRLETPGGGGWGSPEA